MYKPVITVRTLYALPMQAPLIASAVDWRAQPSPGLAIN